MQEDKELEQRRQMEATRLKLVEEEAAGNTRAEEEEEARIKELAALNEANRAKYEAEEAARK